MVTMAHPPPPEAIVKTHHQPKRFWPASQERVTYHNAENGFFVLRAKARGHRDLVTVISHAAAIAAGA
jgi:exodeoxyribonuclease V alpha subunit